MSSNFNRVNIDDKEKDEATMKNRLMDKLCKRQREVEGRGVSTEYEVIDYGNLVSQPLKVRRT
jgi:hypothetical protein